MDYREFPPVRALRPVLECGWTAGTDPRSVARRQQVLPDGCMDLLWTGSELLVAGPDTVAHPALREPGVTTVGLRFRPGALPALLGVPAAALRDLRVPLTELHPAAARGATARMGEEGPTAVLSNVALALPGSIAEPGLRAVAARLGSGATATATADALGWTTRSLHRRCLAAFGYGPTVLRRVLRFRRAAAMLHAGIALADIAARAGYADQPHLSREVRALAGVAPGQLVSGANRSTPLPSGSCTTA